MDLFNPANPLSPTSPLNPNSPVYLFKDNDGGSDTFSEQGIADIPPTEPFSLSTADVISLLVGGALVLFLMFIHRTMKKRNR